MESEGRRTVTRERLWMPHSTLFLRYSLILVLKKWYAWQDLNLRPTV